MATTPLKRATGGWRRGLPWLIAQGIYKPTSLLCNRCFDQPAGGLTLAPGSNLTVLGWGSTTEAAYLPSEDLQSVKVPFINNTACKSFYPGDIRPSM